jgi:hypothetical protein
MNKFGKSELTTFLLIGLVIVGGFYLINNMQTEQDDDGEGYIPSDLTTTITLNTKDALATTSTNANIDYFVFKKKSGEFYKEGTTSSGSDSFDVQALGSYRLLAYNDTSATSGAGYLPEEIEFKANDKEASVKTINMKLNKVGGLEVVDFRDPVDLNNNISYTAGSTQSFQILYKCNVSNAAILNPIIVLEGNRTGIDSDGVKTSTSGYEEVDCPNRLSLTDSANKFWCFEYDGTVTSASGIQTVDGTIKFDDTNDPGHSATGPHMTVYMIDQQQIKEPDYVTEGYDSFYIDAEDTDDSDVGCVDSTKTYLGYNG